MEIKTAYCTLAELYHPYSTSRFIDSSAAASSAAISSRSTKPTRPFRYYVDVICTPVSKLKCRISRSAEPFPERAYLCSNHGQCETRRAQIKMTKGFAAKDTVEGQVVNVVRGIKLYEDICTGVELSKLNHFVNELRLAGRNGELSALLQGVVHNLIQWRLLPENRRPNNCIINFFDETKLQAKKKKWKRDRQRRFSVWRVVADQGRQPH